MILIYFEMGSKLPLIRANRLIVKPYYAFNILYSAMTICFSLTFCNTFDILLTYPFAFRVGLFTLGVGVAILSVCW